jgi:hypothetical protein
MRFILSFLLSCLALNALAQPQTRTVYVAAQSGISLRAAPSTSSAMLEKIPYGEKLMIGFATLDSTDVKADGITGSWHDLTYKGKKGYVVDNFLISAPPPKKEVKMLSEYLKQIAGGLGAPVKWSKKRVKDEDIEMFKTIYKNGMEIHELNGYESYSELIMLPDWYRIEDVFLVLRNLSFYKELIGKNDFFPLKSIETKDSSGVIIKTIKVQTDEGVSDIKSYNVRKISISSGLGAIEELTIEFIGGQMIISFLSAA